MMEQANKICAQAWRQLERMNAHPVKKYPTISCCGVDCGLCPRYHTSGASKCPGCCGPDFYDRHPSCSFITCCVKKKGLEVCALCGEFPCSKFKPWAEGSPEQDSFVTHRAARANFKFIRDHGMEKFLKQQAIRIRWLETSLGDFDDGRSKSYYCIAASLLSIEDLEAILDKTRQEVEAYKAKPDDKKTRSKILRRLLTDTSARKGIELKLTKQTKCKGQNQNAEPAS